MRTRSQLETSCCGRSKSVVLIGMGTSLHPAQCGRIMIEALARVPAYAENASEFRYRNPIVGPDTLVVSISQSGETVDTLAAMEEAMRRSAPQLTICNVEGSQTTRIADGAIMMRCGPEIGVASTKTLTAAMLCVYVFSLKLAAAVGSLDPAQLQEKVRELVHLRLWMSQALEGHSDIENLAHRVFRHDNFLFLGRGISLPVAMEGALKLKEISYIHAEGYPAGEMKHGPIALVEQNMPIVALALRDELYRKNLNNIEESRARDGRVIAIATVGDDAIRQQAEDVIYVPDVPPLLSPLISVIPLQLLAYEIAVRRGLRCRPASQSGQDRYGRISEPPDVRSAFRSIARAAPPPRIAGAVSAKSSRTRSTYRDPFSQTGPRTPGSLQRPTPVVPPRQVLERRFNTVVARHGGAHLEIGRKVLDRNPRIRQSPRGDGPGFVDRAPAQLDAMPDDVVAMYDPALMKLPRRLGPQLRNADRTVSAAFFVPRGLKPVQQPIPNPATKPMVGAARTTHFHR